MKNYYNYNSIGFMESSRPSLRKKARKLASLGYYYYLRYSQTVALLKLNMD